jgi:transcriptional accessory protein Tex/SPT6
MDFWQHLKISNGVEVQGITESLANRFSELIGRGHSVAHLLAHYGDEFGHLPVEKLRAMAQANRTFLFWRKRKSQIEEARAKMKLPPLPGEVFQLAPFPDQLDAIVLTARLSPRDHVASDEEWAALLRVGVDLWTRCLQTCRKSGQVRCAAKDLAHPEVSSFDSYIKSREPLDEIAPHRWLAMRRGEREGALELTVELPTELLLEEVSRAQPGLGPAAQGRTPESLLDELVLGDLRAWLLRKLDSESQIQAIKAATEALTGLLRAPSIQARQLGAVYMTKPGAPVAMLVSDREGDLVAQKAIKAEGAWTDRVIEFFEEQKIQHVVVPTSTVAPALLVTLESVISDKGMQIVKIRSAALSEARLPLTNPPHRLTPSLASALVLARRCLDPLKEWSTVDPVAIGVAEYQNDLDPDQLRAALVETVELCRLERRRGKRIHMGGNQQRGNPTAARLNPLVKSLADLKPGMTIHGVVTNISHFGAFVNIGLPQEALVHISELSDRFVSNPNEVVSIGLQVTAQVLVVDPARGRISLSLKTRPRVPGAERERGEPTVTGPRGPKVAWSPRNEGREGRGGGGGSSSRSGAGLVSKAEALANLEKLFKK